MSSIQLRASSSPNDRRDGQSFLTLPTELILHIASTYPRVNHLMPDARADADIQCLYFERRNALHALSQSSRALRNMFLSLAWECFEAAYRIATKVRDSKLDRLCKGLVETPQLAAHVRIAVIPIRHKDVGSYLIRCLNSLPNLHTLSITLPSILHDSGSYFITIFSRARLPQIRSLHIDVHDTHIFIPSCPKVKAVSSASDRSFAEANFLGLFDQSGESLEELDGFRLNAANIKYIVNVAPNLCRINFPAWIPVNNLHLLRPLSRLQTITMHAHEISSRNLINNPTPSPNELAEWMATAKSILQGNTVGNVGKKQVKVSYKYRYSQEWSDDVEVE